MAIDFSRKATEATCFEMAGGMGLLAGQGLPWEEFVRVPIGSRYFRADGSEWKKIGVTDVASDWEEIRVEFASGPGGGGGGIAFVGYNENETIITAKEPTVYTHNQLQVTDQEPGLYRISSEFQWVLAQNGQFFARLYYRIGTGPWILTKEYITSVRSNGNDADDDDINSDNDKKVDNLTKIITLPSESDLTVALTFGNLKKKKKATMYNSLLQIERL